MERGLVRSAIFGGDPDEYIFRAGLRVLDEDVEIAVVAEDSRIQQFVLHLTAGAAAVR